LLLLQALQPHPHPFEQAGLQTQTLEQGDAQAKNWELWNLGVKV
jgi:hypothetical protein